MGWNLVNDGCALLYSSHWSRRTGQRLAVGNCAGGSVACLWCLSCPAVSMHWSGVWYRHRLFIQHLRLAAGAVLVCLEKPLRGSSAELRLLPGSPWTVWVRIFGCCLFVCLLACLSLCLSSPPVELHIYNAFLKQSGHYYL